MAEVQFTYNPNMPVRMLGYLALIYKRILKNNEAYGRRTIKLSAPQLVVLYAGRKAWEDGTMLKLSDMHASEPPENIAEVIVKENGIRYNESSEIIEKFNLMNQRRYSI